MDIVRLAISKPVGVAVGVILVLMFGIIGLTAIPIQLTPTVDRPIVTVTTNWPGRSPEEIVDEITREQEKELKNVTNLRKMVSLSRQGAAEITLEFNLGADITRALQEVSDALRQVESYPEEVDEPAVKAADGASENAIAWIITALPEDKAKLHPGFNVETLFDEFDDEIKPALERIDGVAEVNVFGGRTREARVLADPVALAQRSLSHIDLVNALLSENLDVSAGTIAEGKRDYRVRLVGEFENPEQILATQIAYRDGNPVYVRDVATVEIGYEKRRGFVRAFGRPALAMNVIRQNDANVVEVMEQVRQELDNIRAEILPQLGGLNAEGRPVGPDLTMRQVYDETIYIHSAVGLVTQNLWVGGLIATFVLLVFLRAIRPTLVVMVAIPISVVGTFLVLVAMGRTLNVISLAGLAFAVGMVVDNAIVVLENIYRRLQLGDPPMRAAWVGGREVWGAILASTLTTAAVFIPVLTIQEEAGQLFRDISIAIVAAVCLSLIVSITVIPAAAARALREPKPLSERSPVGRALTTLFGLTIVLEHFDNWLGSVIRWLITSWRGWTIRPLLIVVMTVASLLGAVLLMPPLDYLPAGNRNLVFGGLLIPPGLSVEQQEEIAEVIEAQVKPYADVDPTDEQAVAQLAPIFRYEDPEDPFAPVPVQNFFIGAFQGGMFCGATSEYEQVVIPVGTLLTNAMNSIPDAFGGAQQSSLFGRGVGGGNTIDIEISGNDLARVKAVAGMIMGVTGPEYGFGNVRPDPSNFSLQEQEFQVRLNDRGRELGLSTQALGVGIRALFDGAFSGEYKLAGDTIDLVVIPTGGRLDFKEQLADVPISTPAGLIVPVSTVVDFVPSLAPQQIQRIEERPSVTIRIAPPPGAAVEDVMTWVEANAIAPLRESGDIDRTMRVRLEGTAAKLDEVKTALLGIGGAAPPRGVSRVMDIFTGVLVIAGIGVAVFALVRGLRKKQVARAGYAAAGALLLACILGALALLLGHDPGLLLGRFTWALIVTYLLMAALFESFVYPFVIMFTVPLAIVGGFAGLAIVHHWTEADPTIASQKLDVLTMLGFVILVGVVVNNAILIVHQALNFMRGEEDEPMPRDEAIARSVRTRMRPIFMSVLTSVGGMLPLVLFPGAGSEMYRGLGSVVVGGLTVSTIFTLVLVPLLFSLVLDMTAALTRSFGKEPDLAGGGAQDNFGAPGQTPAPTPA